MTHPRPVATTLWPLDTLPVTVHNAATLPRVHANELARFEAVLDAVDATYGSAMLSREEQQRFELVQEDAQSKLQAVLASVQAVCDRPAHGGAAVRLPPENAPRKELIRWTVETITTARNDAVRLMTERNLAPGMRPDQVAVAMELMQQLNRVLGGGGGVGQPGMSHC